MKVCTQSHHGFSLVEVLVALIVLSVGMLGVLTLQVKGLQFGQSAMINTKAINAAADMADRIRANPTAISAYAVAFGNPGTEPNPVCVDKTSTVIVDTGCTPAQLAAYDVWQWKSQMLATGGLPSGDGSIVVTPAAGTVTVDNYVIDVRWTERGEQLNHQLVLNY